MINKNLMRDSDEYAPLAAQKTTMEIILARKVAAETWTRVTKRPLWVLEKKLLEARQKFIRTEQAYRDAEKELWAVQQQIEARRRDYEGR